MFSRLVPASARTAVCATAITLVLGAALPAHAAVTYTFTPSSTVDPGQAGSNVVTLDNFNGIDALPQTSYYIANNERTNCASIGSTTASCNSAIGSPPTVNGTPDLAGPPGASHYLAISTAPDGVNGGIGFFDLGLAGHGLNNISFYAGSIDQRNVITLLNTSGQVVFSLTGTDLGAPGYYSPLPGGRVTLAWNSATDDIATLELLDFDIPAFELTNVTSNLGTSAVPEPATIGLTLAGLAMAGLSPRRRRRV